MSVKRPGRIAALAIGTIMIVGSAFSQPEPAKSHQLAYPIDSGAVQNFGPLEPGDDAPVGPPSVVFVHEVNVLGAQWLRLQFDQVLLSGSKANNNASYLLITSMWDGASQKLYADDVHNWNNTSAYLNGGTLVVELYAHGGTGPNRFLMSELTVGEVQPGGVPIESICGTTDDRTLSQDNRQGRLWPIGCTAWMIENGDFGNRFLTAGHCIQTTTVNAVVEFNVQLSTAGGTATHPPPNDQWSVPAGQIDSNGGLGVGNDYAQFFTAVNGTGLTPREANGCGAYKLAAAAPAVAGQSIRITGYGSTTGTGLPNNQSLVQKTHTGPFVSNVATLIRYATDTTGGNSGSPVVDITGGGDAIGIHTHAGCTAVGGSNQGTDIGHAGLQGFLAAPTGTGIAMGVNSVTTTFAANNSGSDGGAVYFDIVTGATAISVVGLQANVDGATFGAAFTCDVYTRPGTFVGSVLAGGWTHMANGNGIVGQRDSASMITLGANIPLPPGSTTAFAIVLDANTGHNYTNGASSYTDGTITVSLGAATNVAFTGPVFNPRTFNGTICYEPIDLPCTAIEIPAMTLCSSQIDMDALPLGPTNAGALNMAGVPLPADLASFSLFSKPSAAAGVYNTSTGNGQALARVGGPGNPMIIDNLGAAAFDATTFDLTFQHAHTQFGFEVGDWVGPAVVNLYNGSTLVANVVTGGASTLHFIQIQAGCTFDRVTIDVSTSGGNFVLTEIWTQAPCCATLQIPAMTVPFSQINMAPLPAGPINVAALNAVGFPVPAQLANVNLPNKPTAAPGVYNTNTILGNALARVGPVMQIINNGGAAPFDATTYELIFNCPHTEFGFEIADWNGPAQVELYNGPDWVGSILTTPTPPFLFFIQAQPNCTFDRATIDTSTAAGNFVLTQIWTEVCPPACPCACNFDLSTGIDVCDIFDFLEFQNSFVAGDPCAIDYDTSTGLGVGDIFDFLQFQNDFVAGCP